jgi:hypothetical protein
MALVNDGLLWDAEAVTGPEVTSEEVTFQNIRGVSFSILLEGSDGTYIVEVYKFGDWRTLQTGTLTTDELKVIDVDFALTRARLKVTPAGAGTLHADATTYE